MARISKKLVDSLKPKAKDYFAWDGELPGFGVRVWPTGRKVYVAQYRITGRTRRMGLGTHGAITPAQARQTAMEILSSVGKGDDPAEVRALGRKAPTLAEFAQRYLSEHAEIKKKPKSLHQDRRMLEKIILPVMGKYKLQAIERADLAQFHHSLRKTPYQANRCLALLSKIFNLAERWGIRTDGSNPCRHIERFREEARERFLSNHELARLGNVLAETEQEGTELPQVVLAIRLLLLTGARKGEILALRWRDVDFEGTCLRLEDSKTGPKTIPLNSPALEALAGAPHRHDNPFVIPGARPGAHLVNLNKPWRRIRERADIPDVRIHDLRHSHAAIAAAAGLGLPVIGALLGHTQAQTTKRYAHVAHDPLQAASEEVGKRIAKAMSKSVSPKVVNLESKRKRDD